jgi:hypothetical protein
MEYGEDEMTTSHDLLTKQKMLDVIQRMPEDATIDDAIYRLNFLKAVAEGLRDSEQGKGMEHEAFFQELENEEKSKVNLDAPRPKRPSRNKEPHRGEQPKKRSKVRRTA